VVNVRKQQLNNQGYADMNDWLRNPNHIYIGRNMTLYIPCAKHSKWNNPFTSKRYGLEKSLQMYKEWVLTGSNPVSGKKRKDGPLINDIEELRGKHLGCWCAPEPCHGHILLECLSNNK
jgi:hypothetical protein